MKNAITNNVLDRAIYYLKTQNWSVIPIGQDKKPLIDWKVYQIRKPKQEELTKWFSKYTKANIGIVTGEISNLIVVDIDPRHGGSEEYFKQIKTIKVKTGGEGWHYYFLYEKGVQNKTGIRPGIDIRGDGGFVVAPPSLHKSGKRYKWLESPNGKVGIAPLPGFIKEWIREGKKDGEGKWNREVLNGVTEGARNDSAASVAGKLLARFPKEEWDTEAWLLLQSWNSQNNPPLPESELRQIFESIKKREEEKKNKEEEKNQSVALQLVEEIRKEEMLFFHNNQKEGFVAIHGDGREVYKIRSRVFKQFIAHYAYKQTGKIISSDVIKNVLQALEGRSIFEGPCHELASRISFKNNAIWYDLGDGRAVHIDKDGWTISEHPPILFRRYAHQQVQVLPQRGGDLKELCNFINLKTDEERLLLLIFTVAAFIPDYPHPLLVLYGPQGSGKTTPQRLLKSLIDPSALKVLASPDSEREFVQVASHHYFLFFDNLSSLPQWLSDALARACTGSGFSKRELFSDDDDIIYSFQRTIALNGINLVVQRADLLERSILIGLERISKKKRREEKEFWKHFDQQKPYLLGAIFEAVSKALSTYPKVNLTEYPRMADFARWGASIALALGGSVQQFVDAYSANISSQNDAALEASPVGTTIIAFMLYQDSWEGTPSELLEELEKEAEKLRINIKSREWPKDPAWLTKRIQTVSSNLIEQGIQVVRDDKARPRKIIIQKNPENTDDSDITSKTAQGEPELQPTEVLNPESNTDINTDIRTSHHSTGPTVKTVTSLKNGKDEADEEKEKFLDTAETFLQTNKSKETKTIQEEIF